MWPSFFPSGKVAVSGGADLALRIWDITDGNCAAKLIGHTAGVLSVDFIDRGRNIVTSGRDGCCILWDIPTQTVIHKFEVGSSVNQVVVVQNGNLVNDEKKDNRDFGTSGKYLLCASEKNGCKGINLSQREDIFSINSNEPINSICSIDENTFVVGDQSGKISYWDIRNTGTPIKDNDKVKYPVTKVLSHNENSCWISYTDGIIFLWDFKNDLFPILLIGSEEPINGLAKYNNTIYSGSREGYLRMHELE